MTTKPNEPEGLSSCPFCGSEAKIERSTISTVQVRCAECVCGTGLYADDQVGRRNAIAAWNRRVPAHPVADAGGVTEDAALKILIDATDPTDNGYGAETRRAIRAIQSVAAATTAKDAAIRARDDHFRNLQTLAKKYAQVSRAKTDLEYMQVELVGMLGPKAKQVWDMWQQKGLRRIHVSWASHLQGEERAEAHIEIDQAPKMVIDSVDGNMQKRSYGDTFSAFYAIADEVRGKPDPKDAEAKQLYDEIVRLRDAEIADLKHALMLAKAFGEEEACAHNELAQEIARMREARDPLREIVLRYIDRMNDVAPECGDPADRILGEFARDVNAVLKAERAALSEAREAGE